jgi:hypothetical protein
VSPQDIVLLVTEKLVSAFIPGHNVAREIHKDESIDLDLVNNILESGIFEAVHDFLMKALKLATSRRDAQEPFYGNHALQS